MKFIQNWTASKDKTTLSSITWTTLRSTAFPKSSMKGESLKSCCFCSLCFPPISRPDFNEYLNIEWILVAVIFETEENRQLHFQDSSQPHHLLQLCSFRAGKRQVLLQRFIRLREVFEEQWVERSTDLVQSERSFVQRSTGSGVCWDNRASWHWLHVQHGRRWSMAQLWQVRKSIRI
jgi:hypothetical protein